MIALLIWSKKLLGRKWYSMKLPIESLTVVFIALAVSSPLYGQITIEQCHEKAKLNYPLIKQYELIEQTKEYNISNANKAYLPQLDVTLIGGIIDGLPSFSTPGSTASSDVELNLISLVQVNQVIWDGGITKAKKKMIEANSEIERADIEVSLYVLEERINNLFFGILLIEEQLRQMDTLISTLDRRYKRVEIAVENGTAFNTDLDEIQVEVINTNQRNKELKFNKLAYINVLSAMIGEPMNSEMEFVTPPLITTSLSDSIIRPELSLFDNQSTLIEAKNDINKAMLYPKIGIMGFGTFIQPGVDFGTSTINNILVAGLSVNWSLGSLYQNSNNKKLVELDLMKVEVQRETFLYGTSLEIKQMKVDLERSQSQIEQDKELLKLKKRIKSAYEVKYENGMCTMSDLLDRVNDESMAQQNLVVHQVHYLMKYYQYQILTGNRVN